MNKSTDKRNPDQGLAALRDALRLCFLLLRVVAVCLLVAFLFSGTQSLEQYEKGVVLRFGALRGGERDQGLVFALPYPVDELVRVPAKRTRTMRSDAHWYGAEALDEKSGTEVVPPVLRLGVDGYLMTGDLGVVHGRATARYRVGSVAEYAFGVADREVLLRVLLDRAMVAAAAQMELDGVMRGAGKERMAALVTKGLTDGAQRAGLGIELLDTVDLQLEWPRQLRRQIGEVVRANQKYREELDVAEIYARKQTDAARSRSSQLRFEAQTWATRIRARTEADVKTFGRLVAMYRENPTVLRQVLHQDALRQVVKQADEVFLVDGRPTRALRMQITRDPDGGNGKGRDGDGK